MPLKRRQRFAKYEQTLLKCGDDIKSLQRFVDAQIVAFRKILKKYRKWTGSSALGHRFKESILSQPKSFTRRDFSQLQTQHDDLLQTLHSALPAAGPGGFAVPDATTLPPRPPSSQLSPSETIVATESQPSARYWNEYDCGSEAGDFDGNADNEYAIYIDPNADVNIPGMKALGHFFSKPIHKLSAWVTHHNPSQPPNPERDPLLPTHHNHSHHRRPTSTSSYGATRTPPELSYFSTPPGATYTSNTTAAGTETDLDESDAHTATSPSSRFPSNRHSRRGSGSFSRGGYTSSSSDDQHLPGSAQGYSTYYTLPSITDQRAARARERALQWATGACFGVAFVLTGIAALLIATGRHKMRLEVDAGVTVGIVTSLGAACAGLCMAGARRDRVGVAGKLAVWSAFAGVCVVNGVLLVLVMGNAARL